MSDVCCLVERDAAGCRTPQMKRRTLLSTRSLKSRFPINRLVGIVQCCSSVAFWHGSGSADPYLWLTAPAPDPDFRHWPARWYTHKTSGFKTSGFKTSGFKTSGFKTSGLQNVRFQNVWFQNVQFLNLIYMYLLNKKYLYLSFLLITSHYGDIWQKPQK